MSLGLLYYLVITISNFGSCFKVICTAFISLWGIFILVCAVAFLCGYSEEEKRKLLAVFKWNLKRFIIVTLFLLFTLPLIPSKKDMIIIAGLSLTEDTIKKTSVELGKTIPSLVELLNDEIREMKDEIKKDDDK